MTSQISQQLAANAVKTGAVNTDAAKTEPERFDPESVCPACGQANSCTMAAGKSASSCWCMTTQFSENGRDLAFQTDHDRCLCQRCATSEAK